MFLVMVSFPDGLVPAETFIDGEVFTTPASAIELAQRMVREEKARFAKVYLVSRCDETGEMESNPYCTVSK